MEEQAYAAVWVKLDAGGLSVSMACDNEANDDSEVWQVPFANCIAVQERFYCACYGLRPFVTGFHLNARICGLEDIPVASAEDVAKLFDLATGFSAAMEGESAYDWQAAKKAARVYIWDNVEKSLILYAEGELEPVTPGTYAVGFTDESRDILLTADDGHTFFEGLRKKLNATGTCQLDDWPNVRATYTWSDDRNWMHQSLGGGDVSAQLTEALGPLIKTLLADKKSR